MKFELFDVLSVTIPENYVIIAVTLEQLKKIFKSEDKVQLFRLPDGSIFCLAGDRDVILMVDGKNGKGSG